MCLINMPNFKNAEMADMQFTYSLANGNAMEAKRLYVARFPNRAVQDRRAFLDIHRRLAESGSFEKNTRSAGRSRTIRTP